MQCQTTERGLEITPVNQIHKAHAQTDANRQATRGYFTLLGVPAESRVSYITDFACG